MYTHTHNKVFLYYKCANYMTCLRRPCRGSGGYLAACHCKRPKFDPRSVRVEFFGAQSGTGTTHAIQCFSPSTSVFPCQYHSTFAPYSFIHLPPTLYNVFLPVLQFSPVSTIPPLLHTHSSIYHPCYTMFFSQYFSFPLSVPFHHCSILIHPSTTHAIKCFSPSTSVFPCQYHSTNAPYSFIRLPPMLYDLRNWQCPVIR